MRKIKQLYLYLKQLEQVLKNRLLSDEELSLLKQKLEESDNEHVTALTRMLKPGMNERDFYNLMVPIERLLDVTPEDESFEISHKDSTKKKANTAPVVFILDHLRSAYNVGSIFRTAEFFNLEKIICTGYTATPDSSKVKKTAMESSQSVDWSYEKDTLKAIKDLKEKGYHIYALETSSNASNLNTSRVEFPCAFVLGNERFGLLKEILCYTDRTFFIPQRGKKNSLNVSVCTGIVANEVVQQWSS